MNFDKLAKKIVAMQTKHPMLVISIFLIISLLLIPGIFLLVGHVEPSLEKVLPTNTEEIATLNNMRTQFGADMMYLLVYAEQPLFDVRDPAFVKYVDTLAQKINLRNHIRDVQTISDLLKQMHDGIIPSSKYQIIEDLNKNPFSLDYVNNDYSFTVIKIRSDTGASAQVIKEVVQAIQDDIDSLESINPGSRIQITGFNAIDKATFEVIMSDFAKITLISLIIVALIVFATFRSVMKGIIPLSVVMVSLLWTMGIVGYLNLTLTVVSMVAAAMIMGLGIDFGIHVVHSYYNERKQHPPLESLTATMSELLRAMVGASLTTIAGFLALLFGVLPAMKNLGIILALGILTTLVSAIFMLPVLVYLYDTRRKNTLQNEKTRTIRIEYKKTKNKKQRSE